MSVINLLEKTVDKYFAHVSREKPAAHLAADVCLIAHRGAHNKSLQIIENTDAAFARALAMGCWGIELDVHTTMDGVLIVNHDPTLKRLWEKPDAIKDLSFEKLRQIAPDIPSLSEVIERYGKKIHLFIELKTPFSEISLQKELENLTPCEDYHLLSLHEPLFSQLTRFLPEVLLLVAVHNNVAKFTQQCLQKNYGGVLGHYLLLNDKKIKQLLRAKKAVGVGMVDSKFGLYRELNRELQWIFSNNIGLLQKSLLEIRAPS